MIVILIHVHRVQAKEGHVSVDEVMAVPASLLESLVHCCSVEAELGINSEILWEPSIKQSPKVVFKFFRCVWHLVVQHYVVVSNRGQEKHARESFAKSIHDFSLEYKDLVPVLEPVIAISCSVSGKVSVHDDRINVSIDEITILLRDFLSNNFLGFLGRVIAKDTKVKVAFLVWKDFLESLAERGNSILGFGVFESVIDDLGPMAFDGFERSGERLSKHPVQHLMK